MPVVVAGMLDKFPEYSVVVISGGTLSPFFSASRATS